MLIIIALTRNNSCTNFNGREVLVSKKVEGFFGWPLIFYRQKLCKIIFASLKNLFSVICGFRIPDSGFLVLGLPYPCFYKENNFKPCLTKQLLNIELFWAPLRRKTSRHIPLSNSNSTNKCQTIFPSSCVKTAILYFPIPHNALCLPPKFCMNYCCEILLGIYRPPKSISQQ